VTATLTATVTAAAATTTATAAVAVVTTTTTVVAATAKVVGTHNLAKGGGEESATSESFEQKKLRVIKVGQLCMAPIRHQTGVSHLLSSKKKHGWTLIISGTQKNNVGSSVPPDGKIIDLLTKSVFFGRYWSVFLCIYHTDTEGKLGQYCWYQKFGGSPSKN
jgi:hypothetical protein